MGKGEQCLALFAADLYAKVYVGRHEPVPGYGEPAWKDSWEGKATVGILDRIEKAAIRDLLGKGWLTHDGMWFFHTLGEVGVEKANALNRSAIKSLAPIEMERMQLLVGKTREKFQDFDELVQFMQAALELTLPESIVKAFHFTSPAENSIRWEWENSQCFAYKGIKRIGAIDGYRCGVIYRIECWLESLGVRYLIRPVIEGCLMHQNGVCAGEFQVFL